MGGISRPCEFVVGADIVTIVLKSRKGEICGMAIIDKEDYETVKKFNWYLDGQYPATYLDGKRIRLHRFLNRELKSKHIDHKDGDTLNNRRSNLRKANAHLNMGNSRVRKYNTKTSKYKGVSWLSDKWQARITVHRKGIYLGCYENQIDAARAYDKGALKYFGEFAALNFNDGVDS